MPPIIESHAPPGPVTPTAGDRATELAFRRSLRASQERRAAAWRRRRRTLVGRRGIALALTGLAVASGGAMASTTVRRDRGSSALSATTVQAVQRALGLTPDGVYGPATRRAVRRFQRRHHLVVDGIAGPRTLAALGVRSPGARAAGNGGAAATSGTTSTPDGTATTTVTAPTPFLAAIAKCESGGNPTAVSRSGRYRGKYQFSRATWRAMGAKGDPAKAPEAVQDAMAVKLLAARGPGAWPACSRRVHVSPAAPASGSTPPSSDGSSTSAGGSSAETGGAAPAPQ